MESNVTDISTISCANVREKQRAFPFHIFLIFVDDKDDDYNFTDRLL